MDRAFGSLPPKKPMFPQDMTQRPDTGGTRGTKVGTKAAASSSLLKRRRRWRTWIVDPCDPAESLGSLEDGLSGTDGYVVNNYG